MKFDIAVVKSLPQVGNLTIISRKRTYEYAGGLLAIPYTGLSHDIDFA